MRILTFIASYFFFNLLMAQPQIVYVDSLNIINTSNVPVGKISWRGLSVVNNKIIWIGGSSGTIAISTDNGNSFTVKQITKCLTCDIRDIEAFDDKNAVAISSGYPAIIFKTSDGGNNWDEVFRKNDSSYFLDALDFWDSKRGIALADPIDGKFILLQTTDGGQSWQQVNSEKCPAAIYGESAFAASGTSLRCWGKNSFAFVSGGSTTKLYLFLNGINNFQEFNIPIISGKSSQGAFSLSKPFNTNLIAISGGDYMEDKAENPAFFVFRFKNPLWLSSKFTEPLTGYKSCIEFVGSNTLITCGTAGADIIKQENTFFDNEEITTKSFNTVKAAKTGNAVFFAGNKGKIARLMNR